MYVYVFSLTQVGLPAARRASDALVVSIMSVQLFSLLRTAFSRLAIEHIQLATDLQRVD